MANSPTPVSGPDARVRAQAGQAAARRYLERYPEAPGADFRAAERDLEISVRDLAPGDPLSVDAAFMLGAIRISEHETRCGKPCPAPGELEPIAELLAVGGASEGAPMERLYPYAMTVDKLYEHTGNRDHIDLAITWLRRAVAHRRVSPGDRRRAQISLAVQYANKAEFGAAIGQFDEVLAELAGRGRRSDPTRDEDRLDGWLGLLETYYQRGGGQPGGDDLDPMATAARGLIAAMTPGYRLRSYALGRSGVLLIQRIMRCAGDPWDQALNAAVRSGAATPIREALAAVPGFEADLGLATGALSLALGLEPTSSRLQPLFAAAMCAARAMGYLAHGDDEALRDFGRLCRIVMGHPRLDPFYRRMCAEFLLVVLARQLHLGRADLAALHGAAARLGPSGDAALDVMIGLLARFAAADGAAIDPALSWTLDLAVGVRAGAELSDAELADGYARQVSAAASYSALPAVHAALLSLAAATRAELARRDGGSRARPFAPPVAPSVPSVPSVSAVLSVPSGLDAFSVRTLASPGVATHGRLAVPTGLAADSAESLLASPIRDAGQEAAVRGVLALALHTRWLRERDADGLAGSIGQLGRAIGLVGGGHPLRGALTELLAWTLLDRAWTHGDHADAEAALSLLRRPPRPPSAGRPAIADLNELLAQAGPPMLAELLTKSADLSSAPAQAAIGSALLLRGLLSGRLSGLLGSGSTGPALIESGDDAGDLDEAVGLLGEVAASLPLPSPRRPDALSDLGLALLAGGGQPDGRRRGLRTMREALERCPAAHPRRAAILLRTAAALAGQARAAYDPELVDEGIDLLRQSLLVAGVDIHGERSRSLHGLGYTLLVRFGQTRRQADLGAAIEALEESRACLEPSPGDPFLPPLLRVLAWAHRQAGMAGTGAHRTLSRSIGRSVLHAHAETVLLQGRSRHAVAATRSIGEDAVRLADWCLADGMGEAAVEALELGRALVLHAATVASDIPALLRDAGRAELALEWSEGERPDVDAVPTGLRHRVLTALRDGAAERRLLAAPEIGQLTAALRASRTHALVYLIPESDASQGRAVIALADGRILTCALPDLATGAGSVVARFAVAYRERRRALADPDGGDVDATARFRQRLGELCDWAWTAAVGPILDMIKTEAKPAAPLRLSIAPFGILGIVPWHAARLTAAGHDRYACAEAIFTTCASGRQLIEAAARLRVPVTSTSAVFVANSGGDLPWAKLEIDGICSALYPGALRLGEPGQAAAGRDDILACLSAGGRHGVRPGVLHFGCHAHAGQTPEQSGLQLAGGELPVDAILTQARTRDPGSPGGLVVLAACASDLTLTDFDEALTLSSAFLAAGAAGVVGSRWEVADLHTALLMFLFHRHLVRNPGQSPAEALRAAQLWMLDPRREPPPEMPEQLAAQARRASVRDPFAWAAFTYHGK